MGSVIGLVSASLVLGLILIFPVLAFVSGKRKLKRKTDRLITNIWAWVFLFSVFWLTLYSLFYFLRVVRG